MERSEKPKKYKSMVKLLDDPQVKTWRSVMSAFQGTLNRLEAGLKEDGFHVSRFQILFYLYFEGPLAAVDLSRKLLVTRGNISTFLKRLESDGQIEVCPSSPSPKRPFYMLSENAVSEFEKVFPKHVKRIQKFVPIFSPAILKQLSKLGEG